MHIGVDYICAQRLTKMLFYAARGHVPGTQTWRGGSTLWPGEQNEMMIWADWRIGQPPALQDLKSFLGLASYYRWHSGAKGWRLIGQSSATQHSLHCREPLFRPRSSLRLIPPCLLPSTQTPVMQAQVLCWPRWLLRGKGWWLIRADSSTRLNGATVSRGGSGLL